MGSINFQTRMGSSLIFRRNRPDKQRQGRKISKVSIVKHKITAPFDSEILRLPKAGTVGYQAVQNLLPDILLMLGNNAPSRRF
jgi:hypothetical protein